jgi:hypothetical protein
MPGPGPSQAEHLSKADLFKLKLVIKSDQGGSRNLFSTFLIKCSMLLLSLMIVNSLVHTKVKPIKSTISKYHTEMSLIDPSTWFDYRLSCYFACMMIFWL